MAGYLDRYGAGEERREKVVKKALIGLAAALVLGGVLFFFLHNFRQERRVSQFFSLLAAHDYKGAYALWGCTDAKPCAGYSLQTFMGDWGPAKGDPNRYKITHSRSCGSGVILTVDFGNEPEILWVQRNDLTMSFSPFPGCPNPKAMLGGPAPR
ncbi:MAG TPA: hypothetical protein VHW24_05170 [Bryobacteraceae bacterium]|nr:hypothetical protein [Bryobacteraceae bacterium]